MKIRIAINGFGRITNWASNVSGKFDYDIIDQILVDGLGRITDNLGNILKKIQKIRDDFSLQRLHR